MITIHCSLNEYIKLKEAIAPLNDNCVVPEEKTFTDSLGNQFTITTTTYNCLSDMGINRLKFKQIFDPDGQILDRMIHFVVNPGHLFDNTEHPYTTIIDYDKLAKVPAKLNELIQGLCTEFPDITSRCILSRIDYCINYWMNSQDEIEEYFKLLQKYKTPIHFQPLKFYDKKKHRNSVRSGEITMRCKSYELSLYLKRTQMLNSPYNYSKNEISHATGQIRIELRARRNKLYSLKKKQQLRREDELQLLQSPNAVDTIIKILKSMYGFGDFYSMKKAKQIIKEASYHSATVDNLLYILEIVKKSKTLDPNRNGLDPEYLKKYLIYFNELNLSPITVPARYINDSYPNPIKYITGESNIHLSACDSSYNLHEFDEEILDTFED